MLARTLSLAWATCLCVGIAACDASRAAPHPSSGSGGSGPPEPAACAGPAATTSFAVQMAEVSGRITKNGSAWAPNLQFRATAGPIEQDRGWWNVATGADGTFSLSLPHGVYDVRATGVQYLGGVVRTGVEVRGPTTLALDFPSAVVTGTVTLAGQPVVPEDGGAGSVCLAAAGWISRCGPLTDAGTFSIEVASGLPHEITWSRSGTVAAGAPIGRLPYGSQELGTRSFAGNTALELDIDAPTLVLRGRVTVDGLPPAGGATVWLGTVTVTVADGASSFAVRILAGTYQPAVNVPAAEIAYRYWMPCFADGCAIATDTEWLMDLSTASPPTGVVEGTINLSLASGRPFVPVPGVRVGAVTLSLISEPPAPSFDPHRRAVTLTGPLDDQLHFRLPAVSYGTYAVRLEGSGAPETPGGALGLEGAVVVDGPQVSWRGSATVVPVTIDVKVNGQAMASDSMLDSQPRGVLTVSAAEPDGLRLFDVDLGETGPVRIERLLLAGRYRLAVHSQTFLGRTYTIGYRQDVLPVGRIDLGVVDIGTGASGPITLPFDLSVRRAQIQVDGAQQLTAGSAHTMLRLVSETGDPFWAELPPGGGAVTMLLYSGCYRTHVYGSDQNAYPSVGSVANDPLLGEVCTCDRASP